MASNEDEPTAKKMKFDDNGDSEIVKPDTSSDGDKPELPENSEESADVSSDVKDAETVGEPDVKEVAAKEPKEKPTGIPLICGSLNWDTLGREKARVGIKPRKVEPAWQPQVISALSEHRITDVITGPCAAHAFFISNKGQLFGLGRNETGQLGLGHTKRQDTAIELPFFVGKNVTNAACGKGHSIVVTEKDGTYAMGDNFLGQLGTAGKVGKGAYSAVPKPVAIDQKVKQVAAGLDFSLFLTDKGTLYSCGSSESGQLGINDCGEYIEQRKLFFSPCNTPVKVHSFFTRDPKTKDVTRVPNVLINAVSAGQHHCLAVSDKQELYTWGFNGHGRLGHRTTDNELVPMQVIFFRRGNSRQGQGVKIAKCSFGGCFALNVLGTVYLWGQNQINKFECPYPIPIDDLFGWNVHDIGPGNKHHLVAADYSAIAFGKMTTGELGMGPTTKSSSRPDKMHGVDGLKILQCSAGHGLSLLLASDADDEAKAIIKQLDVNLD